MDNDINLELVERICHSFGKTLGDIFSNDRQIKYPAIQLPESLLPYPKPIIEKALDLWTKIAEENNRVDIVEALKSSKAGLICFVPDDIAKEANLKMLNSEDFINVIFKRKTK